jgi:hypothetical protein
MTVAAVLVVGLTLPAVSLAGAASAALIDHGPIVGDSWNDLIEDFCGVTGLTVSLAGSAEGQFWVKTTGRDTYPLQMAQGTDTEVLTNLANGRQATYINDRRPHETSVTYNGDGTYTVHVSGTQHGVWYDDAGTAIAMDAGLFAYEPTFSDMGTPNDYSDDVKLGPAVVVQVTGHRETLSEEDFCAAIVPALT